jgi:hypothetical protein
MYWTFISCVICFIIFGFLYYKDKKRAYELWLTLSQYDFFKQYKKAICEKHWYYTYELDDIKILKSFHENILDNI